MVVLMWHHHRNRMLRFVKEFWRYVVVNVAIACAGCALSNYSCQRARYLVYQSWLRRGNPWFVCKL